MNLLFNAVKFTPTGGSVTLVTRESGHHLIFEVIDTGVGISEQHLPFIFDRFWQAEPTTEHARKGTGLGLSIVSEIVAAHHGDIRLDTAPGDGARFTVTLPVGPSGHEPVVPVARAAGDGLPG